MNQSYIVKAGDTLYGISNQFGVNVNDLAELNNIRGSFLNVGQVLKIPSKSGTNPSNMFIYTVKKGDSLYSIAQRFNTTVKEIQKLNYLKTVNLKVGQELRIPEIYSNEEIILPNYNNYIVKKGDTLYSIAKNNNVSVDTIIKDNNLSNTNLKVGQSLKIRSPLISLEIEDECIGPEYNPPESQNTMIYTVKKGDNLYNIARQFQTSETVIMNLNNLKSNVLDIGQKLKIPILKTDINDNQTTTYTVKKGDSLYSIAKKFNKTINDIKTKNNLNTNLLSIGQKLII